MECHLIAFYLLIKKNLAFISTLKVASNEQILNIHSGYIFISFPKNGIGSDRNLIVL